MAINEIVLKPRSSGGKGGLFGKIFGTVLGGIGGAIAAPFTAGASIPAGIAAGSSLGGALGGTVGSLVDPAKSSNARGPKILESEAARRPNILMSQLEEGIQAAAKDPSISTPEVESINEQLRRAQEELKKRMTLAGGASGGTTNQ